jgi:hypothetical protein
MANILHPHHDEYHSRVHNTSKLSLAALFLLVAGVSSGLALGIYTTKVSAITKPTVLGARIYPTPTPTKRTLDLEIDTELDLSIKKPFIDWTDFTSGDGFNTQVPANWSNLLDSPGYNLSNSIHIIKWGERQKRGVEWYDGAYFIASNSATIDNDILEYAKTKEGTKGRLDDENIFAQFNVDGQDFVHVHTSDPRFGTYYAKVDNKVYIFSSFASNDTYR